MTKLKDYVQTLEKGSKFSEKQISVFHKWMNATQSHEDDISLFAAGKVSDSKEGDRLDEIREKTHLFVRQYFDERPKVVRTLIELFTSFCPSGAPRGFFAFENIYDPDEIEVLLLKHLQPKLGRRSNTYPQIAEYFSTSDTTIKKYLNKLRTPTNKETQEKILGQPVLMERARSTNIPESTTHPIFLPLNMVELYTLIDALLKHSNDPIERHIINDITKRILNQTTEYAKERLRRIENIGWLLDFPTNRRSDSEQDIDTIMLEKEHIRAIVHYEEDGTEKKCEGYINRDGKKIDSINIKDEDGALVESVSYNRINYFEYPKDK